MIETKRLLLRRWQEKDLQPFADIGIDTQVMEFFPACLSKEESQHFIDFAERKFAENGFGFWVAELKNSGEFIGFIGLNIPGFSTAFTPCVEVGWRLARKFWGNGYATEGAKAALEYAFNTAKLEEVLAWTAVNNIRSRKVMERIGMIHSPDDDFDHPSLPEGHALRRHALYRIKHSGWQG